MNAGGASGQEKHVHCENKATRIRGGGAAKVCLPTVLRKSLGSLEFRVGLLHRTV